MVAKEIDSSPGLTLEVIDSVTRAPLTGVAIEAGGEYVVGSTSRALPAGGIHAREIDLDGERVTLGDGDSPLTVPLPRHGIIVPGPRRLLIRAVGHAQIARFFDLSSVDKPCHRIALAPAGALAISVRGGEAGTHGELALFDAARLARRLEGDRIPDDAEDAARRLLPMGAEFSLAIALPTDGSPFRRSVDSVAAGEWIAVARVDGARTQVACARIRVTVDAEPGRLDLDLHPLSRPDVTSFRGSLGFSSGWTDGEIAAFARSGSVAFSALAPPIDTPAEERRFLGVLTRGDSPRILRFDADRHPSGRYAVDVAPVAWVTSIDVAPRSEQPLDFVVDEPATVVVRSRGSADGAPRAATSFAYVVTEPWLLRFAERRHATTDAAGTITLRRVARGSLHVEAVPNANARFGECDVDLVSGPNIVDLSVSDRGGVLLSLREGDVPVPWTYDIPVYVGLVGERRERARASVVSIFGDTCEVEIDGAGRHVIALADVPGFEDPEPIEVDVERGAFKSVEVALTTPR